MDYNEKFIKARELVRKRNYREALVILEELYNKNPRNRPVVEDYVKALLGLRETRDRGVQLLLELLEINKFRVFAIKQLGLYCERSRQYISAIEYYKMLLDYDGIERRIGLYHLAKLEQSLENYEEALKYFGDHVVAMNEEIYMVAESLDKLDINSENYSKDKNSLYLKLGKLKENRISSVESLGDCYIELKNTSKGYACYKEVRDYYCESLDITNTKRYKDGLSNVIRLEMKLKNYRGAIKYGDKYIDILNKEIEKLKERKNNFEHGSEQFKSLTAMITESNKEYRICLDNLGECHFMIENYSKALETYEELLQFDNRNRAFIIFRLGKINLALGNDEKAIEYFKILIEGDINSKKAEKFKTFAIFEIGKLYFSIGNLMEALKYFTILLGCGGKNRAYALLWLGKIEMSFGNYDKAREHFDILIEMDGKDKLYALLELGRLEFNVGNIEEARTCFKELIDNDFEDTNIKERTKEYAMTELARLEMAVGNLELAREYFNYLEENYYSNSKVTINNLIYIDIKEYNYQAAYDRLVEQIYLNATMDMENINNLLFYLKYKLGLLTDEDIKNCSYFGKQLMDYNEEDAIEHANGYTVENGWECDLSVFDSNINISRLFYEAKELIQDRKPNIFSLIDKYILEFDYVIGTYNGVKTNKLEVITFSNTKDIVSMYPTISVTVDYSLNPSKRKYVKSKNLVN